MSSPSLRHGYGGRVSDVAGEAQVGGEQPPRVALVARQGGAPDIVIVWRARRGPNTLLLTARSTDGGRTFDASRVVPGTESPGNRGWQSVTVTSGGPIWALWLDHRDAAGQSNGAAHQHGSGSSSTPGDPVARANLSQLFFGPLDRSVPARSLVRGVCYCCRTAAVTDGDTIYAAWRHVYAGSRRDIAFAASRDRGRTFSDPARVSNDGWQIDGCPENGPALAVDVRHGVHVVWPTLVQMKGRETLKLFHALTNDGRTFSERQELPTSGDAYHPQMAAAPDGSVVIVWDELTGGRRQVRTLKRTAFPSPLGTFTQAMTFGEGSASAMYPTVATVQGASVIAWTNRARDRSTIEVRRITY
jgi:hypothetical protein